MYALAAWPPPAFHFQGNSKQFSGETVQTKNMATATVSTKKCSTNKFMDNHHSLDDRATTVTLSGGIQEYYSELSFAFTYCTSGRVYRYY